MCGIFGVVAGEGAAFSLSDIEATINRLFKLSESRGKEASGLAVSDGETITVYKRPIPASKLISSNEYKDLIRKAVLNGDYSPNGSLKSSVAIIGHSRMVTSGTQEVNNNNQPIIKNGLVGIHNGIIVNYKDLWMQFSSLKQELAVDTEILFSLIRKFYDESQSLDGAVRDAFNLIRGSASIALFFNEMDKLVLSTNTGSLYFYKGTADKVLIFASERYILKTLIEKYLHKLLSSKEILHVKPRQGYIVSISDLNVHEFSLNGKEKSVVPVEKGTSKVIPIKDLTSAGNISTYSLRRCTKCILPETMPFVEFDEKGVCNYCRNYVKIDVKGEAALEEAVSKYRSKTGEPDCIVAFSGGRDSSYALHYIKTVLKMNPLAYTYDWGMITDLARRNQARICGKLGIEQILVSADITAKRKNIRRNVEAWLKKPELGMVPLFMAGDKQFIYYVNKLKKQTGIKLDIWSGNLLEKTEFKTGFCGIRNKDIDMKFNKLSLVNKFRIAYYYLKQYLANPSYINISIFDTLFAYFSYYLQPQNYLLFFRYLKWDENEIVKTLRDEYDWEMASDTTTTWRIGDGTASFYNYSYYTVAGFSEIDTFRSNQIREGIITREEALELAKEENKPRLDSMSEYCNLIGINLAEALQAINSIPKLY